MKRISDLKKVRVLAGMTQKEVAEKLGITQSYLSYLERDVFIPSDSLQKKIRKLFNEETLFFK